MSMRVEIADVGVEHNKVIYKLNYSKPLRKYFLKDTFFVEYSGDVDIGSVSDSILVIPIISVVAPVAWAVGADIYVDRLDETFLHSLARIKKVLGDFYPNFSLASDTVIRSVVSNRIGGSRTGLLFSGGLDSMTSYVRHKDEGVDLISVWGCDEIRLHEDDAWEQVRATCRWLADRDGVTPLEVRTDIAYVNRPLLSRELGVDWYSRVAHGPVHIGLCAPLAAARKLDLILIASTYTEKFTEPWSTHPSIDNNVSWADVTTIHDGYELSRQQKINYVLTVDKEYLSQLRSCPFVSTKGNCMKCEKCSYTITGLVVAGIDPRDCNFSLDTQVFTRIKDSFLKGKFRAQEYRQVIWKDIQRHIPAEIHDDICGSREFLEWFREFNFSQQSETKQRYFTWSTLLRQSRLVRMLIGRKTTRRATQFVRWLGMCYLYLCYDRIGGFVQIRPSATLAVPSVISSTVKRSMIAIRGSGHKWLRRLRWRPWNVTGK